MTFGSASTVGLHGPAGGRSPAAEVVAPIALSVTYRQDAAINKEGRVYARMRGHMPNREAVEEIVSELEGGASLMFGSGQAATFSILRHLKGEGAARVGFLRGGYHATRHAVELLGLTVIDLPNDAAAATTLKGRDILWLETPNNPYIEVDDIAWFRGVIPATCTLCVDNTFAPAPIQRCLERGANYVVTSGTKVLNGHSDGMSGFVTMPKELKGTPMYNAFVHARTTMGNGPGSLECWLMLRSLKTLTARIRQQSANAAALAEWFDRELKPKGVVRGVFYPGLAGCRGHAVAKATMKTYGTMLAIEVGDELAPCAGRLAGHCKLLANATSLGSVESLIEWRHQWDAKVSPRLLRISVGLEDVEDLKRDLLRAFEKARAQEGSKL